MNNYKNKMLSSKEILDKCIQTNDEMIEILKKTNEKVSKRLKEIEDLEKEIESDETYEQTFLENQKVLEKNLIKFISDVDLFDNTDINLSPPLSFQELERLKKIWRS
jgi:hypothetical protein